ncbi:unnamed protein product [Macrosiphum euphorbiae]|uniref:THAP-type domain-containing protein n=1 Tax=Macrosiphum euphorbiae TaxID=13131 RepID=A0AAV0Y786_9HEMI|nr:unnamed protein product [Macrosiphum euphorbiae]
MVKRCVICGNVDAIVGVSVHKFPVDPIRQRLWVRFVENNGRVVNRSSMLCSRHFNPFVDYTPGGVRRCLNRTAVPTIVVGAQPVPDRELQVHAEIYNADPNGGAEIVVVHMEDIDEEVVQMDQVNNDNLEFIEVRMDEVLMDDAVIVPGREEMVDNNGGMQLEIDILPQGVDEEVSEYFFLLPISMFVTIL